MQNIYLKNKKLYEEYKTYLQNKITLTTGDRKDLFERLLLNLEEKMLLQMNHKIKPNIFYVNLKLEFNNLKILGDSHE